MARLRKFVCYRDMERPYTRFSKYKKLSYVRSRPVCKVVRFNMGNQSGKFEYTLHLVPKADLQIRDNAIESARQVSNRLLEKTLNKMDYFFQTKAYPHHVLRENPLAAGAGADRMSTGMAHSFGKVIGIAAQVKKNKPVFTIKVNKQHLDIARQALKRASTKLPGAFTVLMEKTK